MDEGCIKLGLGCGGFLLLVGAAGVAIETFNTTTTASSWDSVINSFLIMLVLGVLGIALMSAAAHEWGGEYVSPAAQPALRAIDQDRSLAAQTVEQYNNPEWTDIHKKNVHFDLDYEVYHAKVDGQQLTIARNQATGLYGVVVNGEVLGNGMRPSTTKKVIKHHFHIDPNLPTQKPMKPDDAGHSKEHGMVEIDDPDKKFWDIW